MWCGLRCEHRVVRVMIGSIHEVMLFKTSHTHTSIVHEHSVYHTHTYTHKEKERQTDTHVDMYIQVYFGCEGNIEGK